MQQGNDLARVALPVSGQGRVHLTVWTAWVLLPQSIAHHAYRRLSSPRVERGAWDLLGQITQAKGKVSWRGGSLKADRVGKVALGRTEN